MNTAIKRDEYVQKFAKNPAIRSRKETETRNNIGRLLMDHRLVLQSKI